VESTPVGLRPALALAVLAIAAGVSGCCCFGDLSTPPPRRRATAADDPAITSAARDYLEQHARELLEPVAVPPFPDGGISSCRAAIVAFAASVAVPVITRGHAGTETAAYAEYDIRECFASIRISLQWVAATGAWIVLGAETLAAGAIVATVGTPLVVAEDYDDVDVDLDELFD